jgi:outer membrane protein assembly factor BamA
LVGSQIAVASAEIRFPLLSPMFGWVPPGVPPIEGAIWGDVGIAWDQRSTLAFQRRPGDNPFTVRTPSTAVGFSLRTNVFGIMILRADWAFPLNRPTVSNYWIISFGPSF